MRLKVIGCKVLTRELGFLTASCKNFVDFTWVRRSYHDAPDRLREALQAEIDRVDSGNDPHSCNENEDFDAIVLAYGLCSNGITGLKSQKYKLVVPRIHDCISLFLGSRERYQQIFDELHGGVYWYTPGWIENSFMPCREQSEQSYQTYVELYGEDNAEYLMEMENSWMRNYSTAAYVSLPEIYSSGCREFTKDAAEAFGWNYLELNGDFSLMRDLLAGNWDSDRFLVLQPGETATQSFDHLVIKKS